MRPNAKSLVDTTDRMFEFEAGSNWLVSLIRTLVVPPLAKHIFSFEVIQKGLFSLVSETGISYANSPLSQDFSDLKLKVRAGDRFPYCFTEGESIYNKLREPKFHVLTFSNENVNSSPTESDTDRKYSDLADYHTLPLSDSVVEAFGTHQPFSLLLRPDSHISFIARDNFAERL